EAYLLAREVGFDNINMDLIIGLPGESKEDVAHTLNELKALAPDSITVHSLAIKRAARLNLFKDTYEEMGLENSAEIMDLTYESCMEQGLLPYYLYRQKNMAGNFENVGYAKADKAGIYNILIMEEKQSIVAAGAGASTKMVYPGGRIERIENVKDVGQYIERIDEMIQRKKDFWEVNGR
ncbi:MAG: coproporphyrinogen dehydrogenase HemZ, partial [Lachnospiraceae bacterium]|nr:coproporphyrinogen dehydrogenase HemZ [Lachnospiraceae bacterium]